MSACMHVYHMYVVEATGRGCWESLSPGNTDGLKLPGVDAGNRI